MKRTGTSAVVLAMTLLAGSLAFGAPYDTTRVSVDSTGVEGNEGDSWGTPSISADGGYVAFDSLAGNLVSDDTNGVHDVFVHDRLTGATTRVSKNSAGAQGDDQSSSPSISADGRYVAFSSSATNLVGGDTNETTDIFVHDRDTGVTTCVSVDAFGWQGNNWSSSPSISADGRYVAFWSRANNLVAGDTNGLYDVFVHDRNTATTTRVSVDSYGVQGSGNSQYPVISADGRYVAFESTAGNLVYGDTNGAFDVFLHDRDTAATTRVSVGTGGIEGNKTSDSPALSADVRYVAFRSASDNLVTGDTNGNGIDDIFLLDRETGITTRVSLGPNGEQGNSEAWSPSISADGRYVAYFSYASNLLPGDTNSYWDVFVHDRQTGMLKRVSVDSNGVQGDRSSDSPAISADGHFVAFRSDATNLVAQDTNASMDIFVHELPLAAGFRSAGAQDGWILETSENGNVGGNVNAAGVTIDLGDDTSKRQYRGILSFDTSSLPDDAVVTSVLLRVRRKTATAVSPFAVLGTVTMDIQGAFGANTLLQAKDFQAAAARKGVGVIRDTPVNGWYSAAVGPGAFPFVSKTGATQLRLRFKLDDNNDGISNRLRLHSGNAPEASQPLLVVEYTIPTP